MSEEISDAAAHDAFIAESNARQLEADNNINRPRLSRDQLRLRTIKDNPGIKQSSPEFVECFVLNAMQQEGHQSVKILAQFTGISKGTIMGALQRVNLKIKAAQMEQTSAAIGAEIEKRITEYQPNGNEEKNNDADPTAERRDDDARADDSVVEVVESGNLSDAV